MNYAIVVISGVWIFAIGYWNLPRIGGKTFFTGPMTHDFDAEAIAVNVGIVEDERDKKSRGMETPVRVANVHSLEE